MNNPFNDSKWTKAVLVLAYIFVILLITIFSRQAGFVHNVEKELFWSYQKWINGNASIGWEIVLNIFLFIPFGFSVSELLESEKKKIAITLLSGVFLSLLIEIIQYQCNFGLAEFDDLFNNTIGTVFGIVLYSVCRKVLRKNILVSLLTFIIVCVSCIFIIETVGSSKNETVSQFAFQIDSIEEGQISGYAFPYGIDAGAFGYSIILEDTETGEQIKLSTHTGIDRQDVNQYFEGEYDYSKCGFIAEYDDLSRSLEVLIDWKKIGTRETGIFIIDGKIKGASEVVSYDNTDIKILTESGILLVHNPKYSCDIYQVGKKLYWIVGPNFDFEDDGTTYLQYQLGTTKVSALPERRQQYGNDNIGFNFEEHEITDTMNCGQYRVAVCDIPTVYPITYILTGYHKNSHWIWKEYFRPVTSELMK